jgi:opacity protein-like surface antigen
MKKMLGAAVLLAALASIALAWAAQAFPPNGTYVYSILKNGKRVGTTTVVILRRDALGSLDIYESGTYEGVSQKTHGRIRTSDALPIQWDAGYSGAPFMAGFVALPAILGAHAGPIDLPIVSAFWSHTLSEPVRHVYPKAALDNWPSDIGVAGTDYLLYYDSGTNVVHEATFPSAALGVHLESASKDASAASSFTP